MRAFLVPGLDVNEVGASAIARLQAVTVEGMKKIGVVPSDYRKNTAYETYYNLAVTFGEQAGRLCAHADDVEFVAAYFSLPIGMGKGKRMILKNFELSSMLSGGVYK